MIITPMVQFKAEACLAVAWAKTAASPHIGILEGLGKNIFIGLGDSIPPDIRHQSFNVLHHFG